MDEKIGVFLCACGDNIGGMIDLDAMKADYEKRPDVAFVETHNLLCSPDGKQFFTDRMKEEKGTHAVVAACSPKDHELDFQVGLENAGQNRFLLQMANIREHCSWVTPDKKDANKKARALTSAAINRVKLHDELEQKQIDCLSNIIVIGGGIAGMEAALLASQSDREVTVIDAKPTIGGSLPKYEEVAPTMECAPCLLSPRVSAIEDAGSVTILPNTEVTEVLGYLGSFVVKAHQKARFVDPENCVGCDECMEACPVEVPDEFAHGMGNRKAIYLPFPGSSPNCAVVDRDNCLRCKGEDCNLCIDSCPLEAIDFDQKDENLELTAGAIILSTGFETYDPSKNENLGYTEFPEVYTLAEYERLSSSTGPTGGKIQLKDEAPPKSVAFVHCVGRKELGYCSEVCCEASIKGGILASKESPDTKVYHLHGNLSVKGQAGSALLEKARAKGSEFIAVKDLNTIKVSKNGNGNVLTYEDSTGQSQRIRAQMVVLATGMCPSKSTETFANMLDLARDKAGFFASDHPILRTAQSSLDGVFLAGCNSGPKRVSESIAQGQAAAGSILARLVPGKKIKLEAITAFTSEEHCSGCMICLTVCPYKACHKNDETEKVEVNEVLCHGCGTCVATCPSGAAKARHYTDGQIYAEIREVLHDRN